MEWGKENNDIIWLYMEGSSEEKMSWKDGEQKAKKEDTKELCVNYSKAWLRDSMRNTKKETL